MTNPAVLKAVAATYRSRETISQGWHTDHALPGQTKAESDQDRIMLALERIATILQVMNANLATVAKTMIDTRRIGNGAVSRSGQIEA